MAVSSYHLKTDAPHESFSVKPNKTTDYVESVAKKLHIEIQKLDDEQLIFDISGIDVSIANALRRILLAEVPSMAIEHVYVWANSSILHDEVLAHRLGLVPILAPPEEFEWFTRRKGGAEDGDEGGEGEEDDPTDLNTLVFKLDVKYNRHAAVKQQRRQKRLGPRANGAEEMDVDSTSDGEEEGPVEGGQRKRPPTMTVYSGDLQWEPQGGQEERLAGKEPKAVVDDIILAKLRPGQQIVLEAHCRKGVGKDHAKYSPVATAFYRMLPRITFSQDVTGEDAEVLEKKCPMKVFDIEDLAGGGRRAVASRPRDCTMCRECIRTPPGDQKISLERVADHFIFSVETVGVTKPEKIFKEAIKMLKTKSLDFIEEIEQLQQKG